MTKFDLKATTTEARYYISCPRCSNKLWLHNDDLLNSIDNIICNICNLWIDFDCNAIKLDSHVGTAPECIEQTLHIGN